MENIKIHLSNGEKIFMNISLEEFNDLHLDAEGNFISGFISLELNNLKGDLITQIFTKHILAIEEVEN